MESSQRKFLMVFKAKYLQQENRRKEKQLKYQLAQVKAGNTSENLLNKIRKIIYYLYQANEVTKNLYNNIINSILFTIQNNRYQICEF